MYNIYHLSAKAVNLQNYLNKGKVLFQGKGSVPVCSFFFFCFLSFFFKVTFPSFCLRTSGLQLFKCLLGTPVWLVERDLRPDLFTVLKCLLGTPVWRGGKRLRPDLFTQVHLILCSVTWKQIHPSHSLSLRISICSKSNNDFIVFALY